MEIMVKNQCVRLLSENVTHQHQYPDANQDQAAQQTIYLQKKYRLLARFSSRTFLYNQDYKSVSNERGKNERLP
jgi:hypothetical protein